MRDYYSEQQVRGRKPYYCIHCGKTILMGELHVHVAIGSAGDHKSHRAHVVCHQVAIGHELAAATAPEAIA